MSWNIKEFNGYEPKTTFWDDFSIAEQFGVDAVRDTYKRAMYDWSDNYEYLTELSLVLNHKLWWYWESGNDEFAEVYDECWREADLFALDHLKGEALDYYYRVTD